MEKFKEAILETIKLVELAGEAHKPLIFTWTYLEEPNWEIKLRFHRTPDVNSSI